MTTNLEQDLELFNQMTTGTFWRMKNFPYAGADDAYVLVTDKFPDTCKALISFVSREGIHKVGTTHISVPFSSLESYEPASKEEADSIIPEIRKHLEERKAMLESELIDVETELYIIRSAETRYLLDKST